MSNMLLSGLKKFKAKKIKNTQLDFINRIAAKTRTDILRMIDHAGSGHPGGALSSIDIFLMICIGADIDPRNPRYPYRDKIVVSHGHTSAAMYSVLGNLGFFDVREAVKCFRAEGSIFEGHPGLQVPGIEWCSGSLGQGLSVGCGFAMAAKIKQDKNHIFVIMGDGEQGKGQLQEAREFAVKYRLNNLTAIIDLNRLQASGATEEVMPQNIADKYRLSGWSVLKINGHSYQDIYEALRQCYVNKDRPTLILAETIMGKGVASIENRYEYHGKVLSRHQFDNAVKQLKFADGRTHDDFAGTQEILENIDGIPGITESIELEVSPGTPVLYKKEEITDCRSSFGEALLDIANVNSGSEGFYLAVLDCDLADSTKVAKIRMNFPDNLIECGIQEHNAATVAGALSKSGILTFFVDFGVFGIDETYGQHRMNDFNETSVKLVSTHCGLDTGEDGKTHQCIDYISIMSNLFAYKIIIPADANQTDRAVRYAATNKGNILIAMGRSKIPVLTTEDDSVFYDENYRFDYGKADWIRKGRSGTVITCGTLVSKALKARDLLKVAGIEIGILNLSCPIQLDDEKLLEAAESGLIVTYEDHNIRNGIGCIVGAFLAENGLQCNFKRMGISRYGVSASSDYQYKSQGLDEESLADLIKKEISRLI